MAEEEEKVILFKLARKYSNHKGQPKQQNETSDNILKYCEKDIPLTKEHIKMYNELRLHVNAVLNKEIPWKYSPSNYAQTILTARMNDTIETNETHKNKSQTKEPESPLSQRYFSLFCFLFCFIVQWVPKKKNRSYFFCAKPQYTSPNQKTKTKRGRNGCS